MSKVILKGIKKKYPNQEGYSVKDFNLEIEEGELIVLVGPSGCGKSTTLRMIAGLEDISEGEFIIDGTLVNDVPSKDRDIAMVFQSYALYPHMDVRSNIGYGLKLRKTDKQTIDKSVNKVSNDLGLDEFLNRKPKDLSGGQRQRVALGRAMVRTPKLYLMDEPLSNLDAKLRTVTRAEISRLHRQKGAITIYVTHDQVEAMTMASRIVVMSVGEIQQIGTPREVYNNPKNIFVATFMGQPSMNIVKGFYNGSTFKCDLFEIEVNEGDQKILNEKGYLGKEIYMGVRHQNVRDEELYKQTFSHAIFNAKPSNVEYLGDHISVFFELGTKQDGTKNYMSAKLPSNSSVEVEKEHEFVIETTKLYFFDAETEESIFYESNIKNARHY